LGIGKVLLKECAAIAVDADCGRMEWSVLNWNPAREFYEYLGAEPLNEWTVYRIAGEKLNELGGKVNRSFIILSEIEGGVFTFRLHSM